jgi:hypothetical protein
MDTSQVYGISIEECVCHTNGAMCDGRWKNIVKPKSYGLSSSYPLVNIQKAIENGHRNSGFT